MPEPYRASESECSSLNSVELEGGIYADSDTGLESMSSSETPTSKQEQQAAICVCADNLAHQITRLKCDKLDLLRQNVVSY